MSAPLASRCTAWRACSPWASASWRSPEITRVLPARATVATASVATPAATLTRFRRIHRQARWVNGSAYACTGSSARWRRTSCASSLAVW